MAHYIKAAGAIDMDPPCEAGGVVLSRGYSEMKFTNLNGGGGALRKPGRA